MRLRHEPMGPWTRAHEKFAKAYGDLGQVYLGAGARHLEFWLHARWGVRRIRQLDVAQARHGARQLNAWRASYSGYPGAANPQPYPRQWRRNQRRAAARRTAGMRGAEFQNLIAGTALADLGRLVPSESRRKST